MRLYESLQKIFNEINHINSVVDLLEWDAQVGMPSGAADNRVSQINTLSIIKNDILSSNMVTNLIQEVSKQQTKLNDWQQCDLIHMNKMHQNAKIIPIDLLCSFNVACISSRESWKRAKAENDFNIWLPKLQEVVKLTSEIATIKSEFLCCSKYEALLDNAGLNLSVNTINSLFGEIGGFLCEFIDVAIEKQAAKPPSKSNNAFSVDKQSEMSKEIVRMLKLPLDNLSMHSGTNGFFNGDQFDLRITTSYNKKDFTHAFLSTLHECGYAIYAANLPVENYGSPVNRPLGVALFEAQAAIFEKHIGSSFEFINHMMPVFQKTLKGKSMLVSNIYDSLNQINPSAIMIHADEVTYPAHIMMRYTLEKSMIDGELQVQDLPQAWAEDMKHYLGVVLVKDSEGCIQDMHWASGKFGYFPSYLLGAVIAAQLFSSMKKQIPDVMQQVANGDFEEIIQWLIDSIYQYGSRYSLQEIMSMAVGSIELDATCYTSYLKNKYCDSEQ